MKLVARAGALTALIASIGSAQSTSSPAAKPPKMTSVEATTSTVTKLEDSWATALVRRDRATFERILAPKFVYTEDSVTTDRTTTLRSLLGPDTVTEARNDSMEVHIFGNVAVVTGWLTVKGRGKD